MDTNTDTIQVTKEAAEDCARELSPDDLLRIYSESPEEAEYYKKTLKWKLDILRAFIGGRKKKREGS